MSNTFSNKRKAEILVRIGILQEEKLLLAEAQASYEQALQLEEEHQANPQSQPPQTTNPQAQAQESDSRYSVHLHLSWIFFKQNNINKGLEHIQKSEELKPDNNDSLYIKARCLVAQDKKDEAIEIY